MLNCMMAWSAVGDKFTVTGYGCSEMRFTVISESHKTCELSAAFNGQSSVTIPEVINGYQVIRIGRDCFEDEEDMESLTIPSSICSTGNRSFEHCSVKDIYITDLKAWNDMTFGEGYSYPLKRDLYLNGEKVTDLVLPNTITFISDAFRGGKNFTSVSIPNSVKSINANAFSTCNSMVNVYVDIKNPLEIGNSTFPNRSNAVLYVPYGTKLKYQTADYWKEFKEIIELPQKPIVNIEFSDAKVKAICVANWDTNGDGELSEEEAGDVTSIGTVFQNNTEITSFSEFKYFTGVTTIGQYALSGCTNLSTIEFPSSLTTIERYALYNSGFKDLIFPDNVTSIGNSAVRNCNSLTSVKIGRNSVSFGKNVFRKCTNLSSITFDGTECHFNGEDAFRDYGALSSVIITDISAWCKSTFYSNSNPLLITKNLLLQTADGSISAIRHLMIPDDITAINNYAFYGCESLESIAIPNSVTAIANYAFSGCNNLTVVTVEATEPIEITSHVFPNRANSTLYVPTGCQTAYEAADYWKEFGNIISLANGDTFTATSIEGIVITFQVTDCELKQCQVGYTYEKKKGMRTAIDKSTSGEITIPDVVNGYIVTKVGDYAFYECKDLTKVNLPSSIKSFGKYAFKSCINLEPFALPSNLTYISEGLFNGCVKFVNISLPSTVTSIGSYAFCGCSNLVSINTDNIKSIGSYAFYGCSKLTNICISEGTTSICQGAFENCFLLSAINIPEGVTSIGINAFSNCRSIQEITIPGTVNKMETWDNCWAFSGCSGLKTIILKKGVSVLGNNTFSCCYNVRTVIVENMNPISVHSSFDDFYNKAVLYVPNGAKAAYLADSYWSKFKTIVELKPVIFADANVKDRCVSQWDTNVDSEIDYLEVVSIKDLNGVFKNTEITSFNELKYFTGVTNIQSDDFNNCGNLTSITIPNNVVTISDNAFAGCNKLTSVTVESFTPCELYQNSFPNRANATLYVPIGYKAAYEVADYWKEFKSIVEVDAASTYIAFADPSAKEICITSTNWDSNGDGEISVAEATAVTDLGETFTNSRITSLCELRYFTGLKTIGDEAFHNCELDAITIPINIETIGNLAFCNCSNLSDISLPSGLSTIGKNAFSSCTKLANVIIPNHVTSIGSSAFYYCSALSSIIIPSSVTSIGAGAFSSCAGLESFVVEDGNEVYDSRDNCNALIETSSNTLLTGTKNTIIPASVTSIGAYAFSSQKELSDITIPNSVTSIGNGAFSSCSSLTSINIPYGVNSIGDYTFDGCTNLTSVSIPNSVTSIGAYAFRDCRNLKTMIIPNGVSSINYYAFQYCKTLESVSLPSSISSIESGAFEYCEKLSSVTIYKEKPVYIGDYSTFQYRSYATLHVPYGCKSAYEKATYWKDFKEIIELPAILLGDANGDGTIDTQDAIKVVQYYLGKNPTDFNIQAADVNNDGVVDTQDAIQIIKIYLKKE